MGRFRYVAFAPDGRRVRGEVEARDRSQAIERLQRDGFLPVTASPAGRSGILAGLAGVASRATPASGRRGLGPAAVMTLTRELATLLAAGLDVDSALGFLARTERDPRVHALLADVHDRVRGGEPLSVALGRHGASFTNLHLGILRAGEASGRLPAALNGLADLLERRNALAAAIRAAMVYPALLLLTAIGSVGVLMVAVLPQFETTFRQAGVALPGAMRLLLDLGAVLRAWGPWLPAAVPALVLAMVLAARWPPLRRRLDRAALRLPLVGPLLRAVEAARFARTLSSLLGNGVELLRALRIVRGVQSNRLAVEAVEAAIDSVERGAGLSPPLERSGVLPPRVVHLLRVGEESGRLAEIAERIATMQEEETRRTIQALVSLAVPVATVVMGLIVGGIVTVLITAVFTINDLAL